MSPEQLTTWVELGYQQVSQQCCPDDPQSFWPDAGVPGQGEAGLWCLATVLAAANERYRGRAMELCTTWPAGSHQAKARDLVARQWSDLRDRVHCPYEVLVDYTIHDYSERRPLLLAAEAELYAFHGTGDTMEGADEYAWEFYKFLLAPSRLRLFFARVGPTPDASGFERRSALETTIKGLLEAYGPGLVAPDDEVAIILIPEEDDDEGWRDLRVLCWERQELRRANPWR